MAGKKGQKKRFCADEEKRSICEQALAPGVSVAQVARRGVLITTRAFPKVGALTPFDGTLSGLRAHDVWAMEIDDVDWAAGTIRAFTSPGQHRYPVFAMEEIIS
ncbi:hypothetical protein ACEWPM_018250 [Roseovarius sp. S4756]|uniref:hypothetical protein n=1 Tax=Roseovarius maritimus TaxID=3342637 RepID=UPI0037293C28